VKSLLATRSVKKSSAKPPALQITLAQTPTDWELAHQLLDEEHFLGAGQEAGDRLCQFILEEGQVVAVLIWCAAAWHLKGRDERIGWDPVTRSHRLKLVVQLRRFLVLDKARRPNLASQSLGLALRSITSQWFDHHGYEPLLAESFSDPESHAGTVYKVTNWQLAGDTKGFSQVRNSDTTHDYYEPNGRPKKLWLYPLHPQAYSLMCAPELPEKSKKCDVGPGGERSPLKVAQLSSLRSSFLEVPDPRRAQSRRHPLSAMLTLVALGLLMGGRHMRSIHNKITPLSQSHREAIGLRVREKDGSGRLKMPGYDALNDLMNKIDPNAYAEALTRWLQQNQGSLPQSLALDGKSIGNGKCGMVVTLCRQEDGRPVGMRAATGKKEDSEVSEARTLLESEDVILVNKIVTIDPLHNKEQTLRIIAEKGGDYLVGTKDNTSDRRKASQAALEGSPLF
jgi:hypothetical protein